MILLDMLCECGHAYRFHAGYGQRNGDSWCAAQATGERAKPWVATCNCERFTVYFRDWYRRVEIPLAALALGFEDNSYHNDESPQMTRQLGTTLVTLWLMEPNAEPGHQYMVESGPCDADGARTTSYYDTQNVQYEGTDFEAALALCRSEIARLTPKGSLGAECARGACRNQHAVWYNQSTHRYYCAHCAALLNDANRQEAQRLYGGPLCHEVAK